MAEYKTEKQVNYGWGLSLDMTGKAPAIAKRIFETLADAQNYVNDINDSAIAGLQLSVINDSDSSKNGIYFVKSIGDGINPGILELTGSKVEISDNDLSEYAKTEDVKTILEDYLLKEDLPIIEIPTYNSGDGITIEDDTIGIQIDSESDSFISVSESGLKISGIQDAITSSVNDYLNTHITDSKIIYLNESEWETLKNQIENGDGVWESDVVYMIYEND